MTMEAFNPSPDAESRNRELDEKLGHIFARYQSEGKIVDGKISGKDYSKLQQDVEAEFPDIKASIFNPYLFEHRCIMIHGNPEPVFKTAPWSTSKVVRPAPLRRPASAAPKTPNISFKNKSANDDTPDMFDN